jgi:hypothetical protein
MKFKFNFLAGLLLLLFFNFSAWSTSGPKLPNCPACDEIQSFNLPKNTIWWNPEQSGVGLSIEVQGDRVFGIYYGYDEDGQSTWYTFVGDLIRTNNSNSAWEVNASLKTFQNGSCINCQHQFPQATDFIADIHIEFNQLNHASYKIDDGEMQNIIPFLFGNTATTNFASQTKIEIPNLEGTWVFSYINYPVHEFNPIQAGVLNLSGKQVSTLDDGSTNLEVSGYATDVLFNVLSCRTYFDSKQNISGPICALFGTINDDGSSDNGYLLNIGDIGNNKMIGKKANGDTVEAYKLEF